MGERRPRLRTPRPWLRWLSAAALGYAVGTIPSADIVTRRATGGTVDLRTTGSGNPGALNAMESLGPEWGAAIGIADIAKGVGACTVGRMTAGDLGAHIAGTAAVAGHCYPVWRGVRGGKGVATMIGQAIASAPGTVPGAFVAASIGAFGPFKHRSRTATALFASAWVAGSTWWWLRQRPNGWGPAPTAALPVAALATSVICISRFGTDGPER